LSMSLYLYGRPHVMSWMKAEVEKDVISSPAGIKEANLFHQQEQTQQPQGFHQEAA
ncbi:Hypothetical protein FKW44_023153, partial [Caligus rogercresseyi]